MADVMEIVRAAMSRPPSVDGGEPSGNFPEGSTSRPPSVDGGANVAKGTKPPATVADGGLLPLSYVSSTVPVGGRDPIVPFPTFAPPSPWDQERASRMMFDADTLVEHLGVNGLHPEIQSAADKVVGANRARDVAKFADAITEFEAVVRRVALPGGKSSKLA